MSYDEASTHGRADPAAELYPGRRQLDSLTSEEIAATGVWWFPGPDGHLSGPDDQTVMPMDTSVAGDDGSVEFPEGRFLLHARFTFADGSTVDGHVTYAPGDGGGLRDREPTLCTPSGQIPLWHGVLLPAEDDVATWLSWLGRPRDAVFPLAWRAVYHPPGDDLPGEAAGFVVFRKGEQHTV
jgi:hypothetical protein